jgi:hypothetical protein
MARGRPPPTEPASAPALRSVPAGVPDRQGGAYRLRVNVRARGLWSAVLAVRGRAVIAALFLVVTSGCADIWGFHDLTQAADDSGPDGTSGLDAAADGPQQEEASTDATVETGPSGDDGTSGCGPTNTIANCGACGVACNLANSASASCDGTTCSYVCSPGWEDCKSAAPDTDGCETPTTTVDHCGGCAACDTQTSNDASCKNGTCTYGSCKPGFFDCLTTAPDTDGCETSLTSTDGGASCAVCGQPGCDMMHSIGWSCQTNGGVSCTYTGCQPNYADCNTTPPDTHGCSTLITTTDNCGGCGNVCDTTRSNMPSCPSGACMYASCKSGWMDCNSAAPDIDGCETSLLSVATCGACTGAACDTTTGTPSCDGTTCSYKCNPGRADCSNAAPDTDGCECATPGCCATACETDHTNGVGGHFYDCSPKGDHDSAHAITACQSAGATGCAASSKCCSLDVLVCVGSTAYSVCGMVGSQCYCWQYSGSGGTTPDAPGTVQAPSSCSAACSGSNDATWN